MVAADHQRCLMQRELQPSAELKPEQQQQQKQRQEQRGPPRGCGKQRRAGGQLGEATRLGEAVRRRHGPPNGRGSKPHKASGLSMMELLTKAVVAYKEHKGMLLATLKKALVAASYDMEKNNSHIKLDFKSLEGKSTLVQMKGTGTSGSFKLNKKQQEGRAGKVTAAEAETKKEAGGAGAAVKSKKAARAKKPTGGAKKSKKVAAALPLGNPASPILAITPCSIS